MMLKKQSLKITLILLLIILLPLTVLSQQESDKAKAEKKNKEDLKTTETEDAKKAYKNDLKAPDSDGVINLTGDQSDVWNPKERRDPFASLIQKVAKPGENEYRVIVQPGKRPSGIGGMELKEIELAGILFIKGEYKAMFIGSDDISYLLSVNDQIWDGTVKEIDMNCVTFEQETEDLRFLVRRMKTIRRCLDTE